MSSILGLGRNTQLSTRSTSEDKGFYLTFVERPNGSSRVLASSEITINPAQDLIGCTSQNTLALKTPVTIGLTPFDGTSNIVPQRAINADTANALHTAVTIAGVLFDGSGNINIPGVNVSGNLAGNAATANALHTAVTIAGVSFDGSGDINIPGVNVSGNLAGNAATANALHAAVTIAGQSFDGSSNIDIPGVNVSGNLAGNAATASALATAINIGSVSFNGTQDVTLPWNLIPGSGTVQGGIIHRAGDVYIGGATPIVSPSFQGGFLSAFNITSQGDLTVMGNSDCRGNLDVGNNLNVDDRIIVGSAPGNTGEINALFTVPNNGTYSPYDPTNQANPPTNPVMHPSTMCALFSTTIGGVFPRFGVGIGNDVVTGAGFIQTVTNETTMAFNLKLQPQAGFVGIGGGTAAPRRALDVKGDTWPQCLVSDNSGFRDTAVIGQYPFPSGQGTPTTFSANNNSLTQFAACIFLGTTSNGPSDERIKKNVVNADLDVLYEKFKKLRIVNYEYREGFNGLEDRSLCGCQVGYIAQEVEQIYPCCVMKSNMDWGLGEMEDFRLLDKTKLNDYSNAALQRAIEKIETLEAQVQDLLVKYNTLAARVTDLSLNP